MKRITYRPKFQKIKCQASYRANFNVLVANVRRVYCMILIHLAKWNRNDNAKIDLLCCRILGVVVVSIDIGKQGIFDALAACDHVMIECDT
jgi:hypothetical protein